LFLSIFEKPGLPSIKDFVYLTSLILSYGNN